MLNRTQSFQNCKETDVPGYNDCPNFIYPSKGSGSRKARFSIEDTCGNTKAATAPPPSIKRKVSSQTEKVPCQDKDEILRHLNELLARNSGLSPAEFQYYKKKVLANVDQSLEHEHGRHVVGEALNSLPDKEQVKKIVTEWMMSDTTASKWCPSFLKIVSNADL